MAYHDHSDKKSSYKILKRLASGDDIALISDAGTPLISDPGYRLVLAAREEGYSVVPIPGASAVISALSVAGLPTDKFSFIGFLPAKSSQRKKALYELKAVKKPWCFTKHPTVSSNHLKMREILFGAEHMALSPEKSARPLKPISMALSKN